MGRFKARGTHFADGDEGPDGSDPDQEEDLEAEGAAEEVEDEPGTESGDDQSGPELDGEPTKMQDLREAWAAGWTAKKKTAEQRKSRGFGIPRSENPQSHVDPRKTGTTCSSCGENRHWRGDAECENVKNGKDAKHVDKAQRMKKPQGTHFVGAVAEASGPVPETLIRNEKQEVMQTTAGFRTHFVSGSSQQ